MDIMVPDEGTNVAFFLFHPPDLQHLLRFWGDPKTVVDPVADNPNDFFPGA